jgi:protease IV
MNATFAIVGSAAVLIVLIAGFVSFVVWKRKVVHRNTILEADFSRNHEEDLPDDRFGRILMRDAAVIRDVVEGLRLASEDKNIKMLVAKLGVSGMKMAKIQEIRDAVTRFRNKGKKAVAYAESFGEFGPGSTAYYLSTAFDRIYVQPSGTIGLTGMGMKTPFLRDLLERLGVEPQIGFRKEYKSAAYTLTQSEYTGPHREADQAVMESLLSQIMEGISQSRGLSSDKLKSLFEIGPFTAGRALEEGLVDGLAYRDEVRAEARKEAGKGSRFLSLPEYVRKKRRGARGKKRIALIYGIGRIGPGKSRYTPFGRFIMGSETVSAAFRAARKDKDVKAIVFRIDSPGGSYVASDTIWRETICAKNEGKPVIASMSDVAGSGGYFVAMACDRIIAHPGTITGSIGVVSGKMVTSELWNKVGIHWGTLYSNRNADFFSNTSGYSAEQWKLMDSLLDAIYDDFVRKAADGRKMDIDGVNRAAKGRIWTGRDAVERGLVDELGGFHEAIRAARAAAKIADDERVRLKIFPVKRPFWKRLRRGGSEGIDGTALEFMQAVQGLVESELGLNDEVLRARSPSIEW